MNPSHNKKANMKINLDHIILNTKNQVVNIWFNNRFSTPRWAGFKNFPMSVEYTLNQGNWQVSYSFKKTKASA